MDVDTVLFTPTCHNNLWFLVDFGNGLWVREYWIRTQSIISNSANGQYQLKPLLVLDDGRLVIYLPAMGRLLICDPGSNTFSEVEVRHLDAVAMYSGSLLSLQEGDMV